MAPCQTIAEASDSLSCRMESPYNGVTDFVIVLRNLDNPRNSQIIGTLGWDGGELGYMLNPSFWGNGYMTEAVAILLNHLWNNTDIKEIIANVDPRNSASLKVLERFGFRKVVFEKNSWKTHIGWCDSIQFRLERPQVSVQILAFRPRRKQNQPHAASLPTAGSSVLMPLPPFTWWVSPLFYSQSSFL